MKKHLKSTKLLKTFAIISVLFLFALFSAHAASKLERIGKPLSTTSVDNNIKTKYFSDMVVNKSIIYSTWLTEKKKYTEKPGIGAKNDSMFWAACALIKYNLDGDTTNNFFIKNISDTAGAYRFQYVKLNEQNGVTIHSALARSFISGLNGYFYLNTSKFDDKGNLVSYYTDSAASRSFFFHFQLMELPSGKIIAIERPKVNEHLPYVVLRYDAEGKFIDSNEVIPVITKNDTTKKVYINNYSVKPCGDICVLAENDMKVVNETIWELSHSSIFYLDKEKQKIKWELRFNDTTDLINSRIKFLSKPAYYSNGDILVIGADTKGKKSDGGIFRMSLLRVDTTGKIISRKVIKHTTNSGGLPFILDIHINKYDEAILVGKYGTGENPIGYFAKIDTTGKLVFEEKFKPDKYHYRLDKIAEYEPNKYVVAGMEERAWNKQDNWAVFYKFEDNTGAAKSSVEESKEAETLLFPNPAYNTITLRDYDGGELQVYDIEGKLVISNIFSSEIDVSALSAGTYYVKSGAKSYKFIKK